MKLHLTILPIILTTILVSGCQSTVSIPNQSTDISNASVIESFSNLELWSKQFIGLSKEEAIAKLGNIESEEVISKGKDNKTKLHLIAKFPTGKLKLYLSSRDQKVLVSSISMYKVHSFSKAENEQ